MYTVSLSQKEMGIKKIFVITKLQGKENCNVM